jgi:hypothetical protein
MSVSEIHPQITQMKNSKSYKRPLFLLFENLRNLWIVIRVMLRRIEMRRLILLAVALGTLINVPALSNVTVTRATSVPAAMSITVTNNSGRDIHHLYLSPVDRDAWGPDQLNETVLRAGQSVTIQDVSCVGYEIKLIAEDREGCFVYAIVSCAQASAGWTITADMQKDCGN